MAAALAVAATQALLGTPAAGQVAPRSCEASVDESRWLAEAYRETDSYGLDGNEEWIGSYGGLVSSGDSLFLYDQLRPRIVHLSGDLEERHAFGRQGEGPGEFNYEIPVTWVGDAAEEHVAFDGRQLVVYDRNDLTSFSPQGELRWSAQIPDFNLGRIGVVFVSPLVEEDIIFGMDSLDAGRRRLQLWRVRRADPNHRELLWERPAPRRGKDGHTLHRREARSYWARHQNCVVVSDGGRRFLWVVDLSTLQADSIALPDWEIPKFGELRTDRSTLNIGGREVAQPTEPALLWRWMGLIVDPDGHAWLRAWTQSREEFQVFIVSLKSGKSRRLLNPPGFPTAFGPPGVFYTAREKPETDEHYLIRLERR